jgi:uncharacterized membrane protein YphA (DoxX/SURF4 family)
LVLAAFLIPMAFYTQVDLRNLAIFGGLLQIAAFGAGKISLDRG